MTVVFSSLMFRFLALSEPRYKAISVKWQNFASCRNIASVSKEMFFKYMYLYAPTCKLAHPLSHYRTNVHMYMNTHTHTV